MRFDRVDCAASEMAMPATPAPVSRPVTGTPMVSSMAMPANSNTSARKIFSKKRAIVWLVARSRWFWALRSSKRHMGADRHAPSARK